MGRRLLYILTLAILAVAVPAQAKLNVVATLTDLGWLAAEVGGDDAEVSVLCPGPQDPHYLPAKPSLTRKLRKADLLVYNGLELEVGWLPVLLKTARNSRIKVGSRGEMECSTAVEHLLDVPTGRVDRSGGDIHPLGNPHYLLDPRNGVAVARLMADRMAELDPDHADGYYARAEALAEVVDQRLPQWRALAAPASDCPTIVYHQHWEYLLHWLEIKTIGAIEHRPGINPSPGHVSEVVNLGRRQDCVYVVAATWDQRKIAEKAADRMEAPMVVLPGAVEAEDAATSYLEMFELICTRLGQAACSGVRHPEAGTK